VGHGPARRGPVGHKPATERATVALPGRVEGHNREAGALATFLE
jgi:hypothetical protein